METAEKVSEIADMATNGLTRLSDTKWLLACHAEMLEALGEIDARDPKGIACREGCKCMGCIARSAIRKARGQ